MNTRKVAGLLCCALLLAVSPHAARVTRVFGGSAEIVREGAQTQNAVSGTEILAGDVVRAEGSTARVALELNPGTLVVLGGNASVRIAALAENPAIAVEAGTIEAMQSGATSLSIVSPLLRARVLQPGQYRITVGAGGTTFVCVRSGSADVENGAANYRVAAGQTFAARPQGQGASVEITAELSHDDLDDFARERQSETSGSAGVAAPAAVPSIAHAAAPVAAPSAAPPAPFAQSPQGRWIYSPDLGWCWIPPNAMGLAWSPTLGRFVSFTTTPDGFVIVDGTPVLDTFVPSAMPRQAPAAVLPAVLPAQPPALAAPQPPSIRTPKPPSIAPAPPPSIAAPKPPAIAAPNPPALAPPRPLPPR